MNTLNIKGERYIFRLLNKNDNDIFAVFFDSLSDETKMRFSPHPMDKTYAHSLCIYHLISDTAKRYVLLNESEKDIIGYFIIDYQVSIHEFTRYLKQNIILESGKDILFAPCLSDKYQNKGIASHVMILLIEILKKENIRSLILLGGTRSTNTAAIKFYKKHGFKYFGGYQTDVFNCDMRLVL